MKTFEARKLREVVHESARLTKALAELTRDKLILTQAARETSKRRSPQAMWGSSHQQARCW